MKPGRIGEWIERVREIAPELGVNRVEGLAEYVSDDLDLQRLPAIWVLPIAHTVDRVPPIITEAWEYTLIIALGSSRQSQRDTELLATMQDMDAALRAHIERWNDDGSCGAEIEYKRGDSKGQSDDGSIFFWQQNYTETLTLYGT